MMKQTIEECGFRPGIDVAIALDPALSELEIAYREEFDVPDSIGMYLFWRDHAKKVMDRDAVLAIYEKAIFEYDIPILSIEDGFSEDDREGWHKLLDKLGDRVLVVGDDLVTTNDRTIEMAAAQGTDQLGAGQGQPDRLLVRNPAGGAGHARQGSEPDRIAPLKKPE